MKNYLVVLFLFGCLTGSSQVSIQLSSGYKMYKYDLENYEQSSAIPANARLGIHLGSLEIAAEYSFNPSQLEFAFRDQTTGEERFTEQHKYTYFGGLVGFNTKGTRTGVYILAGAGMGNLTKNIILSDGKTYSSAKMASELEFRGCVGGLFRLADHVFLSIEGQGGYTPSRERNSFAADLRTESAPVSIISYGGLIGIHFRFSKK
jgi:hypothetical protein